MVSTSSPVPAPLIDGVSGKVLLTTVFGDALLPRKQSISVKTLASLVAPLGINERLVRTSLQRMTSDRFVQAERVGRKSFYEVATTATDTFERANARIYSYAPPTWDDAWTIAVVDDEAPLRVRQQLRRELGWVGVHELRTGTYLTPNVLPDAIASIAADIAAPLTLLMRSSLNADSRLTDDDLTKLVDPHGDLEQRHRYFGSTLLDLEKLSERRTDADAFHVRTLLINAWRRVALRTPVLPVELFPERWQVAESFANTKRLYSGVFAASERHLDSYLDATELPVPNRFETS